MHELGITRNVVSIVLENAGEREVTTVSLAIGRLSGVDARAIDFCWDICVKDTKLEGAKLVIQEIAGRGVCEDCGSSTELVTGFDRCSCGSRKINEIEGRELKVTGYDFQPLEGGPT